MLRRRGQEKPKLACAPHLLSRLESDGRRSPHPSPGLIAPALHCGGPGRVAMRIERKKDSEQENHNGDMSLGRDDRTAVHESETMMMRTGIRMCRTFVTITMFSSGCRRRISTFRVRCLDVVRICQY